MFRFAIGVSVIAFVSFAATAQTAVWSTMPAFPAIPNASEVHVHDVEALNAADVWAVGEYQEPGPPGSGPYVRNLLMHFDGQTWTQLPVPNPSSTNRLFAVGVIAPNDVWVAGQ